MAKFNAANTKQLTDVAALVAYAILPVTNDEVQLADGSSFAWIEGSTAIADGAIIVTQTAASAAGRWHKRITAKNILTYAITLETLDAGEISQKNDYAAAGLLSTNFNIVSFTAPVTDGVIVNSVAPAASGFLSVTYENQTGATITGEVLNVKVLVI